MNKTNIITQEQMMEVLNKCYDAITDGLPNTPSCDSMAQEYLSKYESIEIATKNLYIIKL